MDPASIIERFLARPQVALLRAVLDTYGRAPGGLLANGLAFAALFAVVPVALVTLGVAGWLVDDPRIQDELAAAIGAIAPPVAGLVDGALDALSEGAALSSLVGVIGVVWTVSQFYSTLEVAFSRIFTDRPERDLVRRTARGFLLVVGLIGLIIALVVAGSLAAAAETLLPASSTALTVVGSVARSLPFVVTAGVLIVAILYRVLPPRAPRWRAVAPPAVGAGVVIVFLSQAFLYLAPRIVGAAAFAGSLATAFVALAWLSLTFQVLLLGAAWVRVRDHRPAVDGSGLGASAAATEPGVGGQ